MLCELARTDHHRFRVLEPDTDQTKALRALTRAREDLVGTRTALVNQRRAELARFWPGPLGLFTTLHSQISLAFLERYPAPRTHAVWASSACTPSSRASATPAASSPRSFSRSSAALPRPGSATRAEHPPSAGPEPGGDDQDAQRADQAARAPDRDRDPRAPRRPYLPVAVQDAKERDLRRRALGGDRRLPRALPNPRHLAADAGHAAVAIESGKRKAACFRWACNKRLRQALVTLADTSRHHNPWAQDCTPLPARAGTISRAIRTLGRRSCRIVWRCWQDRSRMTSPATARCNALTSPSDVVGPRPDLAATQRMAGAAVTERRAAGPSAKRLTTSRHPLSRRGVDTGATKRSGPSWRSAPR